MIFFVLRSVQFAIHAKLPASAYPSYALSAIPPILGLLGCMNAPWIYWTQVALCMLVFCLLVIYSMTLALGKCIELLTQRSRRVTRAMTTRVNGMSKDTARLRREPKPRIEKK